MSGVHLLRGEDESLSSAALVELVRRLVGGDDRALMVDEFDTDDYEIGALVDAAQTPPFLTDRRVVVGRQIGRFGSEDVAPLVAYLNDPLPTTELVLTGGGGRIAKSVLDAVKRVGGIVVDTDPPASARDRRAWLDEHVAASGLRLDAAAKETLAARLGEDVGRLAAIMDTLRSTFGEGTTLRADDVVPFIGDEGGVPPWDLTDAIDRGDARNALVMLARMLGGGDRHPLQIMAVLHTHYVRMLRLDGAGAHDDRAAAELLGVKSTFQAGKARTSLARLGSDGVRRAVQLLAQADLDLRGAKDWPGELVLEVLVARLARLAPAPRRR